MGNKDELKKNDFTDDKKKLNADNLNDVSGGIKFSVAGGDSKWYFEASANRDILGEKPKHRKIDS